jgi:hypothetical protein
MQLIPQKSNPEQMIPISLQKLENLSIIWASNDLERKKNDAPNLISRQDLL